MTVIDTALHEHLRALKLSGMLQTLDARLAQAHAGDLGHLDFLQVLCHDEVTRRDTMSMQRRIRRARFEQQATLEEFDFHASPKLPAAQIWDTPETSWGGVGTSNPAAVAWRPSSQQPPRSRKRIDVFVRGADNAIWHRHGQSDWVSLGGEFTSGPAAVSTAAASLAVYGLGVDGYMLQNFYLDILGGWTGWHVLDGQDGEITAGPSAVAVGTRPSSYGVFTRGPQLDVLAYLYRPDPKPADEPESHWYNDLWTVFGNIVLPGLFEGLRRVNWSAPTGGGGSSDDGGGGSIDDGGGGSIDDGGGGSIGSGNEE